MSLYSEHYSIKQTPQSTPVPGRTDQVVNDAGGYVFPVDDWIRLDRFLILGSEGGTYYASAQKLTIENAEAVLRCIKADGPRTVNRIVEISQSGRAPKNDPAIFALAMCISFGDLPTKRAASEALPHVCRIGTHLFQFAECCKNLRGWGSVLRKAIQHWYGMHNPNDLAYQLCKYQQRGGWSHRDLLRLAHPSTPMANYNALYRWVTCRHLDDSIAYGLRTVDRKGVVSTYKEVWGSEWPEVIIAFEALQQVKGEAATKMLINAHSKVVTWEMIPTEELKHPAVWSALLPNLPMTATLRNLGRMTANGCLKPMSEDAKIVVDRLTNQEAIKAARIHPVAVLAALGTYSQGHGERGKLEWKPIPQIVDALDHAFYLAFGNVEPTGKRTLLALDVSGSMAWGEIAGIPSLTPARGATAMALVTARTEPNYYTMGFSTTFKNLGITAKDTLVSAMKKTSDQNFGGTDCALPMVWAAKEGIEVDTFVIYTDDETWAGDLHPFQALQLYRKKTGIPAKLVVVAMTSNGFTLADPNDAGMLDVVGFDTATPQLISDFSKE